MNLFLSVNLLLHLFLQTYRHCKDTFSISPNQIQLYAMVSNHSHIKLGCQLVKMRSFCSVKITAKYVCSDDVSSTKK